jgi:tetratricopeptide (TPR) repeat protein
VPGRYTWHDLLRLYAAGRAEAEDPGPVRRAAVVRLLHWQLAAAEAAIRRLYPEMRRASPEEKPSGAPGPGFADHRSALEWLDAERANLVSSARYGAEHGPYPVTWQLADELRSYFWNCGHAVAWRAVTQAGLTAAEAAGDLVAQTTMRMNSGALSWRQDRYDQAIEQYQTALGLARRLARADLEAAALGNLGGVYRQAGRAGEAIEPLSRALLLDRRDGRPKPQNLGRLGSVYWELGRLREAAELHAQAYAIYETIGSRGGQAIALANLGETFHLLGQADQAVDQFGRALALYREVGNRDGEAEALCGLATTHAQAGRPALAVELAAEGLAVARDIGRIRAIAGALSALGAVHQHAGRPAEAARSYAEALDLAREIDHRYPEAEALAGLAAAQLHLDDAQRALALADQARAIAGRAGYRIIEGRARETLAAAYAALGRAALAATEARKARDLHGETGYRLSPNHPPAILEPR